MLKSLNRYCAPYPLVSSFTSKNFEPSGSESSGSSGSKESPSKPDAHEANHPLDTTMIEPTTIMTQTPCNPEPALLNWLHHAQLSEINDPTAAALATVDESYQPSLRMVLIRGWQDCRFVFYTNSESRKGRELTPCATRPIINASLLWHFKSLRKQIRIEGVVTKATTQESDAYFMQRPRLNQLSAWASQQSRVMKDIHQLDQEVTRLGDVYKDKPLPRPPHWYGFALSAQRLELWSERPGRIHHRLVFERAVTADTSPEKLKDIPWNPAQWLWP